jgi:hypothetical protein
VGAKFLFVFVDEALCVAYFVPNFFSAFALCTYLFLPFADLAVLVCRDCHEFGFREFAGCPIANFHQGIYVISANNMESRLVFVHRI